MIALLVWNEDEEAVVKVKRLQTSFNNYLSDSDVTREAAKVEFNSECDKMCPSAAEFR